MSKQHSESYIEDKACLHAKCKGVLNYKFLSESSRGVPDRIFMYESSCWFIEFKAPGKKATRFQQYIHKLIRTAGFQVFVCDNLPDAINVIDEMIEHARQKKLTRLSE